MSENQEDKPIKVFIAPKQILGVQEISGFIFQCPNCETENILHGTNFCRGCGRAITISCAAKTACGISD